MMKLLLLRGNQLRQSPPILRMTDELGKPLELCLFPFGADDPKSCHPLIPRGLGTEEFPGDLVAAKLFRLFTSEAGAVSLFVRIDGRLFFVTSGKSLEAGGMHQALFREFLNGFDVNGAPGAGGLARSEANHVAGFVDALSNAVDPTEAQCNLYGFGPRDAGLAGILFVEAHEQFAEFVVTGFEPGAEVGGRREECWFWRHGFQPDAGGHQGPSVAWGAWAFYTHG